MATAVSAQDPNKAGHGRSQAALQRAAILPDDVDPSVMGPVLCAGVTVYKALLNADIIKGEYFVVMGAGGGLGHFVIQYGLALGAKIIAIGSGDAKKALVE